MPRGIPAEAARAKGYSKGANTGFNRGRKPSPEDPGDLRAIRRAAAAALARRDLPAAELAVRLSASGFANPQVEDVVAEFVAKRFIDDARFADRFVAHHVERGHGPLRIRRDLIALGVAAPLVDQSLHCGPDFLALCRELRRRRFGPVLPQTAAEKGRESRFLQYRGFSSEDIRSALGFDTDLLEE